MEKKIGRSRLIPGRKYNRHPLGRYPNHNDHRGRTIKDHTWVPHEELLGRGQNYVCYQGFQWKGINHHGDKIFPTQPSKFAIRGISESKHENLHYAVQEPFIFNEFRFMRVSMVR